MHKKGMMVVIAVGAGKPAPNGKTCKGKDMIKVPMEALIAETEEGSDVSPEVGSTVVLESVEGTVREINEDGTVHVEVVSANGVPIEYAEEVVEETEVMLPDDMADIEKQLLAAAEEEDELPV